MYLVKQGAQIPSRVGFGPQYVINLVGVVFGRGPLPGAEAGSHASRQVLVKGLRERN